MGNSLSPFGLGPSDPFSALHREMNRLFDDAFRGAIGRTFQDRTLPATGTLAASMDVSETENELKVVVDLPGVKEEDVDVILQDDLLTIRGERKTEVSRGGEKENYHYVERSFGSFQRSLQLPFAVKADQVQARFQDGVLKITLPKSEEQKRSRRIQIAKGSAGGGGPAGEGNGKEAGSGEASGSSSTSRAAPPGQSNRTETETPSDTPRQ
jgi:HSP20 family protein